MWRLSSDAMRWGLGALLGLCAAVHANTEINTFGPILCARAVPGAPGPDPKHLSASWYVDGLTQALDAPIGCPTALLDHARVVGRMGCTAP